jgi:Xaa-Pro dipeptidase
MGADKASCWLAIGERPAETYMLGLELATSITPQDRVQIGTTVMLDGYFSQVLRIGVFSEPSARLQEVSEALISMQDEALAAMQPGNPVTDIGNALESAIDAFCPYKRADDPFRFQSCHAMGNSYSEPWSAPYLNADRDRSTDGKAPEIAPHQTYEIHPNFTLPDLGHVCAGDVGLVTPTGGQWMSRTPRGLLRIV